MKIHLKQLFSIFLLILSFSIIYIPINLNSDINEDSVNQIIPLHSQSFTDSLPIKISSDSDFLSYGFPGSGSVEDPYRIENLKIDTSGYPFKTYGIEIENVSKSFIIQNCRISASFAMLIASRSSESIQINNNWCEGVNQEEFGILVTRTKSHSLKVINNTCLDYYDGMDINYASYSVIENNTLTRNHIGLRVVNNISFSRVIHNYCMNNRDGMEIANSIGVVVKNNYIYNNFIGFLGDSTSTRLAFEDCSIVDNLFDNNTLTIYLIIIHLMLS
ncbi:MAG: right-handed parallel beta-helix repeat-containing protein [Candidatus Lokiarchaeota archaeon]